MRTLKQLTHRFHLHPRMSANQLSEYLSANAPHRRRILQDAKFPSTMVVIRYDHARKAVVSHMSGSETALDSSVSMLCRRVSEIELSEYFRQNYDLCIEALESFQANLKHLAHPGISFRRPTLHNAKLGMKGVNVSVSADLVTERRDRNGARKVGAAILIFAKPKNNYAAIADRCRSTALMIYQLLLAEPNTSQICDPTLCGR
jgi:hypothetical protein